MFAKLLKYEWQATAGLLGILSGAVMGAGLLGGAVMRFLFTVIESAAGEPSGNSGVALAVPAMLLLGFILLGIIAYSLAVQIILYSRFYKSRFTDEGYLTFTLPVATAHNYLSALTNILIWQVISGLAVFAAFALLIVIGIAGIPAAENVLDINILIQSYGNIYATAGYGLYPLLSVITSIASAISAQVLILSSITMGAVLAKKHKVLASIGIYYGVSMAVSTLTSVGLTLSMMQDLGGDPALYGSGALLGSVVQLVIHLALAVGGSFLSVWLMEKKLNLP